MSPITKTFLHAYTDFDSTVVLQDTGDTILAHEMGQKELDRVDRLPQTDPENVSLRQAEDLKWEHIKMSIPEAVDILIGRPRGANASKEEIQAFEERQQTRKRTPVDGKVETIDEAAAMSTSSKSAERNYRVSLDPGFEQFYAFCKAHAIPLTVISIGIQPLLEEMLDRYLGKGHGIAVRANGLSFREDGSWKVLWRDSSPFGLEKGNAMRQARAKDLQTPSKDQILWCGDGSSDYPAALESDQVFARSNTSLERLCQANETPYTAFTTFETVQDAAQKWILAHGH